MSNKKQTALDFYREHLMALVSTGKTDYKTEPEIYKQANEMFEQQIIEAYKTFLDTTLPNEVYEEYYNETFKNKIMKKEIKSGMYGEMPKIKIGKYTIADMSNDEECSAVWIEDTQNGDGGAFTKEILINVIDEFYKKYF